MEAKFGLRICDSKPSDMGARGHSDPMDVGAVNSLSSCKGKGSSGPRGGCLKCGGAHFQRDCNARKSTVKQSSGKGKQSKSWSTREDEGKSKENNGKPKGQFKGFKGATGSSKGKTSKTGISGRENVKSETSSETQESAQMGNVCASDMSWIHDEWSPDAWNDGRSLDEWNNDWSSVGWHEDCEQTCDTPVSSFSLESFDFGAQRNHRCQRLTKKRQNTENWSLRS